MLSIRVASLVAASFVLPVIAVTAQTPADTARGIFFEQPGGELKKIAQEISADLETKGAAASAFSYGIVKPKHVITHAGAQSALVVSEGQPSFLFRFGPAPNMADPMAYMAASADMPLLADNAKDFVLVRLEVADGNRVFNSGKVQKVSVDVQNLKPREFRVRVKQPLTPGEYAFYVESQRKGGGFPTSMWAFSYRPAGGQ